MPAPANFDDLSRADQLAYLYSTYGGSIEDRQRATGQAPVLTSPKFRANNIATASYVTPEERALWGRVKSDGGTWLGNALGQAAPYALAAGLAYAGGTAISNGLNAGNAANASNLGIFANNGANGLASLGGGNAGALAASGGISGGAGIGGTTAGALGGASGLANSVSGVSAGGSNMWDWGKLLDYGAPIVGGLLERQGSKDAANASSAASQAGINETRRQYDQNRTDQMPWLDAGRAALGRMNDPTAFSASPDYEFRRGEGMRGIENSFAARGGAASGNALRALTDFNSELASGEYGNWWNRQAGIAGVGQTSAQNLGAQGANSSANIANLLGQQGDARASGITGQTNALTGILQNLGSTWNRRRYG